MESQVNVFGPWLTVVRNLSALYVEVNAGLEDSIAAGVSVDADPSRGVSRAATRGSLGGRDCERAGDGSPGRLKRVQRHALYNQDNEHRLPKSC